MHEGEDFCHKVPTTIFNFMKYIHTFLMDACDTEAVIQTYKSLVFLQQFFGIICLLKNRNLQLFGKM